MGQREENWLIQTSKVTNQTNPLMTGLFTREINVLNWLHSLRIFCYFLVRAGNADVFPCSRCRTPGSERRLPVNVLRASPKEKLGVDFGTRRQTLPTNPAFFLSPLFKCVGSGSCWRSEGKEVKEDGGKNRGGGTAPGPEEDIICMCTEAQGLWPAA